MIAIDSKYAYLALVVPFVIIWLLLFVVSKTTRREQFTMSILIAPLGPLSELLYTTDYWLPQSVWSFSLGIVPIFLEDTLFAFAIGGISGVVYEVFAGKRLRRAPYRLPHAGGIPIIIAGTVGTTYALLETGLNSIFATTAGFVAGALLIVLQRRDLLLNSLASGLAVASIMAGAYALLSIAISNADELLREGWLLYGTPLDIRILGHIPLTEIVWGFGWGLLAGPVYEFWKHLRPE